MDTSPFVCLIDTIAPSHVSGARSVEKNRRSIFELFNQKHLFNAVIDDQLAANQIVIDLCDGCQIF